MTNWPRQYSISQLRKKMDEGVISPNAITQATVKTTTWWGSYYHVVTLRISGEGGHNLTIEQTTFRKLFRQKHWLVVKGRADQIISWFDSNQAEIDVPPDLFLRVRKLRQLKISNVKHALADSKEEVVQWMAKAKGVEL